MINDALHHISGFKNLKILAKQIVEGTISGIHKSPFHGFSAEFAEHKIYNQGESTRHIDWKLFAKTDKLYNKRYDEETNLRCHIIIDNSSSMHYPALRMSQLSLSNINKIGFSVLASAVVMQLLKKQRDTFGLSVYSDSYDFYTAEKGSERHHNMLLNTLEALLKHPPHNKKTSTSIYLHQIAKKIHRRSMILLFTDMFEAATNQESLFEALRHLKYNKHEVVLFHVMDKKKELNFNFDDAPKRFYDLETGTYIDAYTKNVQPHYEALAKAHFKAIKLQCARYKITYIEADINAPFDTIIKAFLRERTSFL